MLGSVWYFDEHFGDSIHVNQPEDLQKVKAIVLWGGEDISPSIYGQVAVHAEADDELSNRDKHEVEVANEAIRRGIPIIGVCRGAQLLCALGGGTLWQHVSNHVHTPHMIQYKDRMGMTNSYHHQMMRPVDAEILAATPQALSVFKYADSLTPIKSEEPEPEIVYFPKLNAVGVQGHPEWLSHDHFLNRVMKEIIKDKLNVEVV